MMKHRKSASKKSRVPRTVFDTTRSATRVVSVRRTLRYWQGATSGVTSSTMAQSVGSDQISALSADFAHYAEIYQEYRILAVRATIIPRYTMQSAGSTSTTTLPPMQGCAFSGIAAVSATSFTVQELADAQSFRHRPAVKSFTLTASANMNDTAKLWFSTQGAISPLATIGVVWSYAGALPAVYNGLPIWDTLFEWDVEFKSAL